MGVSVKILVLASPGNFLNPRPGLGFSVIKIPVSFNYLMSKKPSPGKVLY